MSITSSEFVMIRGMIYEESGIFFKEQKTYFLDSRIQARLQQTHCSDFHEYIQYLKYDKTKKEFYQLIDSLTTNETYFFREQFHLDAFSDEILPVMLAEKKKSGVGTLRIWSAGCSTGEEPYTLAMTLLDKMKDISTWNVQIIATDISERVLTVCRAGVYSPRSLKDTPEYYKGKYFTKLGHTYKVNMDVKKLVQFSQLNLCNRRMMRTVNNIDCILCRNVLIYFGNESAKKVINCFYDSLNSGGVIFLGSSESMRMFSGAFQMAKYNSAYAYRKG